MFILNEPADTGKMQKSSDKFVYEYTVDVITRTWNIGCSEEYIQYGLHIKKLVGAGLSARRQTVQIRELCRNMQSQKRGQCVCKWAFWYYEHHMTSDRC